MKHAATTAVLGLMLSATALPGPAHATVADRADLQPTRFAMSGSGFGTRLTGGDVPAGSGATAFHALGCTNVAGKSRGNHVADLTLPDMGTASQVSSRTWTTERRGVVSVHSRASVERVILKESGLGRLAIRGITSRVRAFHDGAYRATVETTVASLAFTDSLTGETRALRVPTPGEPVTIPGVATVAVGHHRKWVDESRAKAVAEGLRVDFIPTGSRLRLAKSGAQLTGGVKRGLFGGRASSVQATALEGLLSIGRLPLTLMPCKGTGGEVVATSAAEGGQGPLVLSGLSAEQYAASTIRVARGYERAAVSVLELNDGALRVEGVTGRAFVKLTRDGLVRNLRGTTPGSITADGEPLEFPDTDVLEVPGVAKLERRIVQVVPGGISVIALRITLLGDTGGVIDLGKAKMVIRSSGR